MFAFENELEKSISEEIQIYASKEYSSHLISVMLSKEASSHISVAVDSMSLFESNIAFAHYIFQNPRRALKLLDNAFQKVSLDLSKTHALKSDMLYKENLHVRLIALPNLPEVYRSSLPGCSDVGQFLCISGTIVKASTAKILQYKKLWRCTKCKYQFIIEAAVEQGYICEKPVMCENPESCYGKNFTLMNTDTNAEYCKDYQEIKLQEQVYNLSIGTVPKSMWVILEDDLVEMCHPGNDVIVSGILIQQWKPLNKGNPIDIELVILAHNIEVQNKMTSGVVSKDMILEFKQFWSDYKSDPLSGRNFILSSICPQVFGLFIVKLAVALVLAGGVQKKNGSSRIRGDSHLLLVGDPGTAKSQFLKFVTKVSPRSVLTSGIGTTNAGLTVSAVKESGRWELEAGALVLADGGICCIDEFSCIKEQDKTCIHEAMEQQTISVAKAGLVCSLNTRCSILAATNPKGKYDETMSLSENTALGTPLLSRFDIILVLLDTYDENWDNMVASYILDGRKVSNEKVSSLWSVAKMKDYFTLIRHVNPRVTSQAERILRAYYTKQRSLQSRNTSRTTPRLLQSLIRLAEGHARLMLRTEVLILDAIIAIILVDSSMLDNSILEGLSPLHTIFPDNPVAEYIDKAEKVFQNLNIEMNIEENYECFYEETNLKKLLCDISAVCTSKDIPYLFGSSSHNNSSSVNLFEESDDIEISNSKNNSDESGDLYHKPAQRSDCTFQNSSPIQQIVFAEIHENDISTTTFHPQKLNDRISTFSDMKTNFSSDIIKTGASSLKCINNVSILNQILEIENDKECIDIEPSQINTEKYSIKKQFSNHAEDEETNLNDKENHTSNYEASKSNFTETFENDNTDILEKLGISPEKKQENMVIDSPEKEPNRTEMQNDSHTTFGECSKLSSDKSTIVNEIFPPKRSLADQLKNFAFSKSRFSSHQNLNSDKNISSLHENNNKPGISTLLNVENKQNKLETKICKQNNTVINQFVNKKSAFKMIVDRYKSSQSNVLEKNDENCSTSRLDPSTNSQCQDTLSSNQISNKITENEIDIENKNTYSLKKDISYNKLKKFVFCKSKTDKSKDNDGFTDEK